MLSETGEEPSYPKHTNQNNIQYVYNGDRLQLNLHPAEPDHIFKCFYEFADDGLDAFGDFNCIANLVLLSLFFSLDEYLKKSSYPKGLLLRKLNSLDHFLR